MESVSRNQAEWGAVRQHEKRPKVFYLSPIKKT